MAKILGQDPHPPPPPPLHPHPPPPPPPPLPPPPTTIRYFVCLTSSLGHGRLRSQPTRGPPQAPKLAKQAAKYKPSPTGTRPPTRAAAEGQAKPGPPKKQDPAKRGEAGPRGSALPLLLIIILRKGGGICARAPSSARASQPEPGAKPRPPKPPPAGGPYLPYLPPYSTSRSSHRRAYGSL